MINTQTTEIGPISEHSLTHEEAWLYCLTLSYDGHKDWRLPTYDEWHLNKEVYGYLITEQFPERSGSNYITPGVRVYNSNFRMQQVPVRDAI